MRFVKIVAITFTFAIFAACGNRFLTQFDRIEVCESTSEVPAIVKHLGATNGRIFMNLTIVRNVKDTFRIECDITRCLSKEVLDTCVPFTTMKPFNTCLMMGMENMAWTNFIYQVKPPLVCPLKKGDYILTNGSFDVDRFKFFPLGTYYWKTVLKFIEGIEFVAICVDLKFIKVH